MIERFKFRKKIEKKCYFCKNKLSAENISVYKYFENNTFFDMCLVCSEVYHRFHDKGRVDKNEEKIRGEIYSEKLTLEEMRVVEEKRLYLEKNYLQ